MRDALQVVLIRLPFFYLDKVKSEEHCGVKGHECLSLFLSHLSSRAMINIFMSKKWEDFDACDSQSQGRRLFAETTHKPIQINVNELIDGFYNFVLIFLTLLRQLRWQATQITDLFFFIMQHCNIFPSHSESFRTNPKNVLYLV